MSHGTVKSHMRAVHFWGEFKCEFCDATEDYAGRLFLHHRDRHPDETFCCSMCYLPIELSRDVAQYEAHFKTCLSLRKEEIRKKRGSVKKPVKVFRQCDQCGKAFIKSQEYEEHMREHEGKPPLQCEKCVYTTYSLKLLVSHMNVHLREEGKDKNELGQELWFPCSECDKKFTLKSSLSVHYRKEHLGVPKTYPCDICGASLQNRNAVTTHKYTEHGIGGVTCHVCGASGGPRWIKQHMRSHEAPKLFCKFCGKGMMSR